MKPSKKAWVLDSQTVLIKREVQVLLIEMTDKMPKV
jgi:hypothetical protein